jgi:hypothetical protein
MSAAAELVEAWWRETTTGWKRRKDSHTDKIAGAA